MVLVSNYSMCKCWERTVRERGGEKGQKKRKDTLIRVVQCFFCISVLKSKGSLAMFFSSKPCTVSNSINNKRSPIKQTIQLLIH